MPHKARNADYPTRCVLCGWTREVILAPVPITFVRPCTESPNGRHALQRPRRPRPVSMLARSTSNAES